jgi:hypothetical protein
MIVMSDTCTISIINDASRVENNNSRVTSQIAASLKIVASLTDDSKGREY